MKDAKGHGSESRGGGGPASYQNVSTKPVLTNAARDRIAAHGTGVNTIGVRAPIQPGQFFTHDAGSGLVTYHANAVDDAGVHATTVHGYGMETSGVLPHGQLNNLLTSGDMQILTRKSDITKAQKLNASGAGRGISR